MTVGDGLLEPGDRPSPDPVPPVARSAGFLESLLEGSDDCVEILDPDGRLVFVSAGGRRALGPAEPPVGADWLDFWSADTRETAATALQEAVDGVAGRFDGQSRADLGSDSWWSVRIRPMGGVPGRPQHLLAILRDVTASVIARERRAERGRQLEDIANDAPVITWLSDVNGKSRFISRGWLEFSGQTQQAALDEGWLQTLHPDERASAVEIFRSASSRRHPFEMELRLRRRDGAWRWVINVARPRFAGDGAFLGYVGSLLDITERKEAEDALREREERLDLALDAGQMGTWDWNIKTDSRVWSEGLYKLLGQEADTPRPDFPDLMEKIHPDDLPGVEKKLDAALKWGSQYKAEYRVMKADGSIGWFSAAGTAHYALDGSPTRMLGVFADISERKAAEAELHQAHDDLLRVSRLSAMGAMASTLAHELNQPLTAIANYLAAAQHMIAGTGERDRVGLVESIEAAKCQSLRAGDIIRKIRNFTLDGEVIARPESLGAIVREACSESLPTGEGRQVLVTEMVADAWVKVDKLQIVQVIRNLVRNGLEATPPSSVPKVKLTSALNGAMVELRVSDTGSGMSPETVADLFQPFKSSKTDGLGLGLSICRTIVEAHYGHIWLERTSAGGTTFVMSLPAVQAEG